MAKGLLMERYDITTDEAWKMLVKLSQTGNVKLNRVAAAMVEQHDERQ
jgi:AmiR/NasT family two-component response regulator